MKDWCKCGTVMLDAYGILECKGSDDMMHTRDKCEVLA